MWPFIGLCPLCLGFLRLCSVQEKGIHSACIFFKPAIVISHFQGFIFWLLSFFSTNIVLTVRHSPNFKILEQWIVYLSSSCLFISSALMLYLMFSVSCFQDGVASKVKLIIYITPSWMTASTGNQTPLVSPKGSLLAVLMSPHSRPAAQPTAPPPRAGFTDTTPAECEKSFHALE